jgi:hypothetical protein
MNRFKSQAGHVHKSNSSRLSRRQFLGSMGAAAAFTLVPRAVLGGQWQTAPSDKTTLACIGMGGQGHVDLYNFLQIDQVQVAAVCDVNREGGGYISPNSRASQNTRPAGRTPIIGNSSSERMWTVSLSPPRTIPMRW